ncbi:DNA-binding response regulator, OmpR family, contains REC and winged-helix (wHTH) domain [Paenibacillus sp. 1_12]|uniref:response regulator transcription factor n=1 Tax=Paenibacillus sp. 1_12 TaxID=1566278 RepID=UPI0008DF5227|nr:response regulator transcription factor [Paenibacillus sp. 1_12]SFL38790.1 DNA-binding response regulator, OmpR family, contains REC and winged-helix (wHTH) domain [Paenibacillus sp. 1_12]
MNTLDRNQVLIVEDDDHIRRFVAINLDRNNFSVSEAALGELALSMFAANRPDVVVLDIMLPDMDGFELCRRLRDRDPDIVIIFITARGQDLDKIKGLELGADDYIVKPFNPLELVARIRTILRRTQKVIGPPQRTTLQSGSILLDLDSKKLFKHDCLIEVTPKEYQMVKVFLENPDKALSRDILLNLIWGVDYVGDTKTVDVHVRKLREKMEDDCSKPQLIETVWGLGYRWRKDG